MSNFRTTSVAQVRRFAHWQDPGEAVTRAFGFTDGVLPDDQQVVVDDELRVHLPGKRVPLASDRRSDWALFCQEHFGLQSRFWPRFDRHPLNTDFVWNPVGADPRVLSEAEVTQYNEQGYVVIEDALDQSFLEQLTGELDAHDADRLKTLERKGNTEALKKISFSAQPSRQMRTVRQLSVLPVFQHLGHDLIGPDVRLYWDQSVYKPARCTDPFPWHQDTGYTYVDYQQCFTVWIALTDANVDTGCLWVLPGGHRVGTLRHAKSEYGNVVFGEDPGNMIPVPVRAGSMAVFAATLPHMTGANKRGWTRKAVMLEYAPDGMNRIAVDPWGNRTKTPAAYLDSHYQLLRDGVPTSLSI
ncbi:phytanoyl-CoA dioxygenase family protein [Streptomyces sp. SL13]|jgi:ectoine hydroxylase-related dioxygenase (phytanoyl-CoA dioxygenase family)|uniref:Phytanoyl-CoA dioxygenase family protein n=1 Tax=Streptantibioticus silvisoli TaxID=2705255 RepID=A0AA90GYT4_9ACTN|nr:phytanoyl-CoA dioxygenase family protein [Streptantibioticus silvisoli]MDI5962313.1 phytanoyl-CoA dioxygenase family protein [Streptantibioticus silvisoli]MDI5970743.1 phytanoyl-CoA dioxygenase family protein [Streptantibioticus silvisoli]